MVREGVKSEEKSDFLKILIVHTSSALHPLSPLPIDLANLHPCLPAKKKNEENITSAMMLYFYLI